jgi:hypothetical protein
VKQERRKAIEGVSVAVGQILNPVLYEEQYMIDMM